jgi:hypothetical protein
MRLAIRRGFGCPGCSLTAQLATAGGPSLHCTVRAEGALSLRFLQEPALSGAEGVGGDAAGATLVRSPYPLCMPSSYPPFAEYAKDGAPAAVKASAV